MEETMFFWSKAHALATICTGAVLFVTLILIYLQFRSSQKTQELQGFLQVEYWLQREEIRKARRRVYELEGRDHLKWSQDDRWEVEKVCHNFDAVGDMLKKKLINKRLVDNWEFNIKRCWRIAWPMAETYREERNPKLWESFRWLAEDVYKVEREVLEQ